VGTLRRRACHEDASVAVAARQYVSVATGIELRGVWHTYHSASGPVRALDAIDLRIEPGELLAVLGPSGCGKSTLQRILAGLLKPSGGEVRLDGYRPLEARRQRAIGWLAQEDGLLPWRTVADNVALPLRLAGRDTRPVEPMLEHVGLGGNARSYPHELSGGMRQRAALGRALVAQPRFLLLDEPFAHLDELTRERLGDLLLDLQREFQPTVVLVTHSVAEAVRLGDRVVVLSSRPGRVLFDEQLSLPRPRTEDDPGFGACVTHLKAMLHGH
jgi:NitT/TauT family transport system ATP-binding protein